MNRFYYDSGDLRRFILHFNVFGENLTVSRSNDIDLMKWNWILNRYSAKSIKGFVESVEKRKFQRIKRGERENESRELKAIKNR